MNYLVTGATGLVGRHLVPRLLARGRVSLVVRPDRLSTHQDDLQRWSQLGDLDVITGDVTEPGVGLAHAEFDHAFHLAALYDLDADAQRLERVNVGGTRNVLDALRKLGFKGVFHYTSSVAVAGDYAGAFTEAMLEAGQSHPTAYHRSKFEAERMVRGLETIPYRVYRPSAIVGHSDSGEMLRHDGAYHLFGPIKRLRTLLPGWVTVPAYDTAPINMVPVDFVATAIDHLAHAPGLDRQTFHIVDPSPPRFSQTFNLLAEAAGAPKMKQGKSATGRLRRFAPGAADLASKLGGLEFLRNHVLEDFEVPASVIRSVNRTQTFATASTLAALEGSGIECPPQATYVDALWHYWARHLDPSNDPTQRARRKLADKRVLITGASSGIGASLARQCAAAGAHVVLVARREAELAALASEIEASGGRATWIAADLSDLAACDDIARKVLDEHGTVDVLINNAGRSIRRPLSESLDRFHDFERVMAINFYAPLRLIRGFLPAMLAQGSGHVVNVLSAGAAMPSPNFGAYTASKAALGQIGDTLAAELVDENIHVMGAYLGFVRTPMMTATEAFEKTSAMTPDQAAEWLIEGIVSKQRRLVDWTYKRRHLLSIAAPKTMSRLLNVAYRLFAKERADGDPELKLDRDLIRQFVKGSPM